MANSDDREENLHYDKVKLVIPHLVLASLCLVFLAFNFWCYRRSNLEKYRRKAEKTAHDLMSGSSRRVTAMTRYSAPPTAPYNVTNVNGALPTTPGEVPHQSGFSDDEFDASNVCSPKSKGGNDYAELNQSERASRKRDAKYPTSIRPIKAVPLGLFTSSAASGKNNRLPAL